MSKEEFCGKLESPCGNDSWGWCQSCPKRSKSAAANKATEEGELPEGWREVLQQELKVQQDHYGEVAAAASVDSRIYAGERDCTEGVILGVQYAINRLEELAADRASRQVASQPQASSEFLPEQYLKNVSADVVLALRNTGRESLASLLEGAVRQVANKAAEEGGLPNDEILKMDCLRVAKSGFEYDISSDSVIEFARKIITADRASRQVANKEEVEPVAYLVWRTVQRFDGDIEDWIEVGKKEDICDDGSPAFPVYGSPPATTGASTARNQVLEEALQAIAGVLWEFENKVGMQDEVYGAERCKEAVRALFGKPVGASTVLTDERIDSLILKHGLMDQAWPAQKKFHAFAREVAAQAGQVLSVPSNVASVPSALAVQEDIVDAKRYRWFKENYLKYGNSDPDIRRPIVLFEGRWYGGHFDNINDLDAAIDEAMQAPSPAKESK